MKNLLAQNPFGQIKPPSSVAGDPATGIGSFLNVTFRTMIVVAGVWTFINLILAGYGFLSAGDDSKKVAGAWAKIWQSLLGLAFAAGAFVLAAIFGQLIFKDYTFILSPKIPELQ